MNDLIRNHTQSQVLMLQQQSSFPLVILPPYVKDVWNKQIQIFFWKITKNAFFLNIQFGVVQ